MHCMAAAKASTQFSEVCLDQENGGAADRMRWARKTTECWMRKGERCLELKYHGLQLENRMKTKEA